MNLLYFEKCTQEFWNRKNNYVDNLVDKAERIFFMFLGTNLIRKINLRKDGNRRCGFAEAASTWQQRRLTAA